MARADALPRPPVVELPRSSLRRWRFLVVVAALLVAHVIGWRLTKIDIPALVGGLPNARYIIASLLTPEGFERNRDEVSADGQVTLGPSVPLPAGGVPPRNASSSDTGQTLVIVPSAARPGEIVNVQGTGWPAGEQGEVFLSQRRGVSRSAGAFQVAADGTINYAFYVPEWASGEYDMHAVVTTLRFGIRATETLALCLRLMVETLFLALMGTSIAVLFSVPLAFLGSRNLMSGSRVGRAVYVATRIVFNLLRSIEVVIVVTIMAVIVGIGSFAGVLALVVHSIGVLGKLYSEAIEGIDPGPVEAITATGARPLQVVRYAVVPQVVPQFLSFTLYRLDVNVRMSTIVGMVGGGGIGFILTQYINLLQWRQAGTAIWLIAIVVTAFDYLSSYLREKII
jgi:phosphonate transport system permease protein